MFPLKAIGLVENQSDWYLGKLWKNHKPWPALVRKLVMMMMTSDCDDKDDNHGGGDDDGDDNDDGDGF